MTPSIQELQEIARKGTVDAARELIQIYQQCEWRATKREILRLLGRCHTGSGVGRTLEFLFDIASTPDPVLAEAALNALGQTHSPQAAAFLATFYLHGPENLKPAASASLARIPDRSLVDQFAADLKAQADTAPKLVRNLVLALGELKASSALPQIQELIERELSQGSGGGHGSLLLSSLLAFGKIARDITPLESWETRIAGDALEYQIFSAIRSQVQIRSQWKLEDYLQRLFAEAAPHPSLPLELASFPEEDVVEGLSLFKKETGNYLERVCTALRHLESPRLVKIYESLLDLGKLADDQLDPVLKSLNSHRGDVLLQILEKLEPKILKNPDLPAYASYLQALSLTQPHAASGFRKLFGRPDFSSFGDNHKMAAVNALCDHSIAFQMDSEERGRSVTLLAEIARGSLLGENERLQGRAMRALGRLHFEDRAVFEKIKDVIEKPTMTASSLAYLEGIPGRTALTLIGKVLAKPELRTQFGSAALRALRAQPEITGTEASLNSFTAGTEEIQYELLKLLAAHPVPTLLPWIEKSTGATSTKIQLSAIIALKTYDKEGSAEILGPLLKSKNPVISGRALDTLTALPGLRARRLCFDHLRENPRDLDLVDKIVRSLQPIQGPDNTSDYFSKTVEGILEKDPKHPLWEGLVSLRDRFRPTAVAKGSTGPLPVGPAIAGLEESLRKKITGYDGLDESVKAALRSAELPFEKPEFYTDSVDKAASVLEFCKALDLHLEKQIGRALLFPKIERALHEFQTVLHAIGLDDESNPESEVLKATGLRESFTTETFPLHKMRTVAHQFFTGRIVNDRFRALDGLRAWAVILLLFSRKNPGAGQIKVPLPLPGVSDSAIISLSKRLIMLQEIRNPAAHRQTYLKIAFVDEVRTEVIELIQQVQRWKNV